MTRDPPDEPAAQWTSMSEASIEVRGERLILNGHYFVDEDATLIPLRRPGSYRLRVCGRGGD